MSEEEIDNLEEIEVEQTEFGLCAHEIDEWIEKLLQLKEIKLPIEMEMDEANDLVINFDEECECEEEEEDEEAPNQVGPEGGVPSSEEEDISSEGKDDE